MLNMMNNKKQKLPLTQKSPLQNIKNKLVLVNTKKIKKKENPPKWTEQFEKE